MAYRTNCCWWSWELHQCLLCSLQLWTELCCCSEIAGDTAHTRERRLQLGEQLVWQSFRAHLKCDGIGDVYPVSLENFTVLKGVYGLLLVEIVDKAAFEEECFFFLLWFYVHTVTVQKKRFRQDVVKPLVDVCQRRSIDCFPHVYSDAHHILSARQICL